MKWRTEGYRKRASSDLTTELAEMRRECFNIRFQQASEKATNAQILKGLRRQVARIMTVLKERQQKGED